MTTTSVEMMFHRRACMLCGALAIVEAPMNASTQDVDKEFSAQGRMLSTEDGTTGTVCWTCATKHWTNATQGSNRP